MANTPRQWQLVRVVLPSEPKMLPMILTLTETEGAIYNIGRNDTAAVTLNFKLQSSYVSKAHCRIYCRNGVWRIVDLKSTNGTYLNKSKIVDERELRHLDEIGIGVVEAVRPMGNANTAGAGGGLESYFVFSFQQVGLQPNPIKPPGPLLNVKKEEPELIHIDSDDDEPTPGPSSAVTRVTPLAKEDIHHPVRVKEQNVSEQNTKEIKEKERLKEEVTAAGDAEEHKQTEKEEANRKGKETEVTERKQKAAEDAALQQKDEQEAARKRKEAEVVAALKRKEAEEAAARKRREAEQETARLQKEAEDAACKRKEADEAALKKKEAEEAARKKKEAEEAALKKKEAEEAALKKKEAEEAARKKKEVEAAALKKKEAEAAALKKKEAEAAALKKKEAEEAARKKKEAEESALKKKEAEEAALKQKEAEEAAHKKKATEAAALKKKQAEDAAADLKRKEAEETARKHKETEAARKLEELEKEAARKRKEVEEEAARKQKEAEEENVRKRMEAKLKRKEAKLKQKELEASEQKRRKAEEEETRRKLIEKEEAEERKKKEDALIAWEQFVEIKSGSSSASSRRSSVEDATVSDPATAAVIEQTRKKQKELTENLIKKNGGVVQTVQQSSPQKTYKRIISRTSSNESLDDGLEFLEHAQNPFVASAPVTSVSPKLTKKDKKRSRAMKKLLKKVRKHPLKIKISPVVSLSHQGEVSFSFPQQWSNLDVESVSRVAEQFCSSCERNDVVYSLTPVSAQDEPEKMLKRKEPGDKEVRLESVSKKQRTHTSHTSALMKSPEPEQYSVPFQKSNRPTSAPATPSPATSAHVSKTPSGGIKVIPLPITSAQSSHPRPKTIEPVKVQHQIAQDLTRAPTPATSAQIPPPESKSPTPKRDFHEIVRDINERHVNDSHTRLIDVAPLPQRRRTGHREVPPPKRPTSAQNAIEHKGHGNNSSSSVREKLHQLALNTTKPVEGTKRPLIPAPAVMKVTKKTRNDLLAESLCDTQGQLSSAGVPKKPVNPVFPTLKSSTGAGSDFGNSDGMEGSVLSVPISNRPVAATETLSRPTLHLQQRPKPNLVASRMPRPKNTGPKSSGTLGGGISPSAAKERQETVPKNAPPASVVIQNAETANNAASTKLPLEQAKPTSSTGSVQKIDRLPEDQVYRDALMWNPQWLQEQAANSKPPPVVHGRPMLTNLPIYKDYESYKNTFYPLMLLELWASIFQDSKTTDLGRQRTRQGVERFVGCVELPVAIENVETAFSCPLLLNPNQQSRETHRRQRTVDSAGKAPFYHCIRIVALVDKPGEINRERDFGTITFDFKRTTAGDIQAFSFFAFFQEPQYEEINGMTLIPACLETRRGLKRFKATIPVVTHIKYDINKLALENVGTMKKISYISPKIRDFRALSQLPDSVLFQQILSPPKYKEDEVMKNQGVPRSELVASTYDTLNPVQRSVVHHISQRILKIQGADMMLLHGPAGTGKTRTIVGLLMQLTMDYRQKNPAKQLKILVCTPSNTAVDEIIRRLMQQAEGLKIVRIGGGSVSEDTKQFMLEEAAKPYLSKSSQIDSINQSIAGVDRKIENAKAEICVLKATDERKNSTVVSSLEANIVDWQRDREMYIADLNTVGLIAQRFFEQLVLKPAFINNPDLKALLGLWMVVKILWMAGEKTQGESLFADANRSLQLKRGKPEDWKAEPEHIKRISSEPDHYPAVTIEYCGAFRINPSVPKWDIAITLKLTCIKVLDRLKSRGGCIRYENVLNLLRSFSAFDDPYKELVDLVDNAELQNFSHQSTDDVSYALLPPAFRKSLHPVHTEGDGNCFYRAMSTILFGAEDFFEVLRVRILLDVLKNEVGYSTFTLLASSEDQYDGLVHNVATLCAYAGDAVIYATSKILRRPIHVYTDFPNAPHDDLAFARYMSSGPRNYQHRRTLFDDLYGMQQPACIHYRSYLPGGAKNHFVALLPRDGRVFRCGMDEYVNLRKFGM